MSVDLYVAIKSSFSIRSMFGELMVTLKKIFPGCGIPPLSLVRYKDGEHWPTTRDLIPDSSVPMYLVLFEGEPEAVGLLSVEGNLGIIMGAQRTNLEYVLGAAIAITVAQQHGAMIEDERRFFSSRVYLSSKEMLAALQIHSGAPLPSSMRQQSELFQFGIY
ncbi:hypothetical protein [Bryobacter aggregatus]|uniref:hypothetical protein n=1 Tax=Bryobacter aggregatus TaxID=360054 RepID=UPI0004E11808|nr:hypothetical protein [Bryobacter aggregatus]